MDSHATDRHPFQYQDCHAHNRPQSPEHSAAFLHGQILVVPEMLRNVGNCPSLRYKFDESGVPHFLEMDYPPGFKKSMELMNDIFTGKEVLSKREILDRIMKIKEVKDRRARDVLDEFIRTGKVKKDSYKDEFRKPENPQATDDFTF